MDWEDLRIALHVARAGSIRRAGLALGVSHATVLRRLRALEQSAGVRLFARKGHGYEPTAAGQDLIDTAAELEESVLGLERRVVGRDLRLTGDVRVTLPDPFAPLLMPVLTELLHAHPGLDITVSLSTSFSDLGRRAADVAVRTTSSPPADLLGRRVGVAAVGIYGHDRYLEGRPTEDLEALDWVGWERGSSMFFARWMADNVPRARIALRVDVAWGLREAVDAGIGVVIVPCALGEGRPGWRRLRIVREAAAPLWILTHRDLRRSARVQVVRDALVAGVEERRALIEGR